MYLLLGLLWTENFITGFIFTDVHQYQFIVGNITGTVSQTYAKGVLSWVIISDIIKEESCVTLISEHVQIPRT